MCKGMTEAVISHKTTLCSLTVLTQGLILKLIFIREGNGTHSSTLAWKVPWMEEHGRLQSMWTLKVGHD